MKVPHKGAIDCDLHPALPNAPALLPHLSEYWRDQLVNRHIDRYSFVLTNYPPNSPLTARPDWRRAPGMPGDDLELIRRQARDGAWVNSNPRWLEDNRDLVTSYALLALTRCISAISD